MDRALFGGTPEEKPDLYRRSNPITYADDVRAPVLFVIGENDSRCPLGQALAYVDRLADARGAARGVPVHDRATARTTPTRTCASIARDPRLPATARCPGLQSV